MKLIKLFTFCASVMLFTACDNEEVTPNMNMESTITTNSATGTLDSGGVKGPMETGW